MDDLHKHLHQVATLLDEITVKRVEIGDDFFFCIAEQCVLDEELRDLEAACLREDRRLLDILHCCYPPWEGERL